MRIDVGVCAVRGCVRVPVAGLHALVHEFPKAWVVHKLSHASLYVDAACECAPALCRLSCCASARTGSDVCMPPPYAGYLAVHLQ